MATIGRHREPAPSCPNCGSRGSIREILYGLPANEPDSNRYVLGGCEVDDLSPKFQCINCDWAGPTLNESNPDHVDVTFDMRIDANGLDPDSHSKTLRNYHRILWSKPLPNGSVFLLNSNGSNSRLTHESKLGTFSLASDSITHSYQNVKRMSGIIQGLDPEIVETFRNLGYTIGGFIVFPSNRIENKLTINGARGLSPMIADRFDLTLECIRLHYQRKDSPLSVTLDRYQYFFDLFESFEQYVDFFLLQDLVDPITRRVKLFTKNTVPFSQDAFPKSTDAYLEYRENSMAFLAARNKRVQNENWDLWT